MDTVSIFCAIDDFCKLFEPHWQQVLLAAAPKQRDRKPRLCLSEVLTIIVGFHLSGYRTFKGYYTQHVLPHQGHYFPKLVSYPRFVELMPGALLPLCVLLTARFGPCSGISFIDSTKISVCHNRRIWSHKVFRALAKRGKTSVDWFYGFKLHLVVNDCGELLAVKITAGNVDDRNPVLELARALFGKLFGDRGYISQRLFEQLWEQGVQLITKLRKNMKNRLLPLFDKLLLRKRSICETINDQLKNISQIEHSRHRSPFNFFVNMIAGLVAYTFREKNRLSTSDSTPLSQQSCCNSYIELTLCYTSAYMERRRRGRYKTKQQKKVAQTIRIVSREIPLTDTDRITYVYVKDKTTDVIQKVINVSYEAWIEKRWLTILRYDSTHGYLHQHARFSLTQEKEFISKEHILQLGSHQDWLTWAIENIKTNFMAYRQAFFKRSNLDKTEEY